MLKQERCIIFVILVADLFASCKSWKAVPMNHAKYALRDIPEWKQDKMKRDYQHSVYKMGHCASESLAPVFLKKRIEMTISTRNEAADKFIYLLSNRHTINIQLQCVVMRVFTNRLFILYNSRFPMYYCQGIIHYMLMNTIQRLEIHEFFLGHNFKLPANIIFEFYHPTLH